MLFDELVHARANELRANEQTINNRMQWAEIRTIERLENALRTARGRFTSGSIPVLKTN